MQGDGAKRRNPRKRLGKIAEKTYTDRYRHRDKWGRHLERQNKNRRRQKDVAGDVARRTDMNSLQ
jgi:hypothetical protein